MRALLNPAVEPARIEWVLARAAPNGECIVASDETQLLGCVCLSAAASGRYVIEAIAVLGPQQGHGVGRRLIEYLIDQWPTADLWAETDRAAVGFYARLGFQITTLGEKYPGVERFACSRNPVTRPAPMAHPELNRRDA
jgi:GNAT superfamily N-acetyltransferase